MSYQFIIKDDTGDCYCNSGVQFNNTANDLYIGTLGASNDNVRTWMPFTVNLPRGTIIDQAYITYKAFATSNSESNTIRFACEAADNVTNPSSQSDLYGRSIGSYTHNEVIGQYVGNTEYTYQIDNPIQEVLERAGWASGNRLAVIVDDVNVTDKIRRVYSANYSSGVNAPYLTLNVQRPRPKGVIFIMS